MDAFDRVFLHHVKQIKKSYHTRSRQEQIRVEQWMLKLSEVPADCAAWKRNRNLYSTLLLSLLQEESCLTEPFDKRPSAGPLPQLASYLALPAREKEAADRRRAQRSTVWDDIVDSVMRNMEREARREVKQKEGNRSSSRGRQSRRRSIDSRKDDASLSPPLVSRSPHTRHTPELVPRKDIYANHTEKYASTPGESTPPDRRRSADHDRDVSEVQERKESDSPPSNREKQKKRKEKGSTAQEDPLTELQIKLLEDQLREAQEENARLRQGTRLRDPEWRVAAANERRDSLEGDQELGAKVGYHDDPLGARTSAPHRGGWDRWGRNPLGANPSGVDCDSPVSSLLGSTSTRRAGKRPNREKRDSPITDSDFGSLCSDCYQHQPLREEPPQLRGETRRPLGPAVASGDRGRSIPGARAAQDPLDSFLDEFRRNNAAVAARVAALTTQSSRKTGESAL